MKPRRILRALGVASACLLFSSCGGSENPLSDPLKATPDERLLGIWRMNDNVTEVYYHVGRAGDKLPPGVLRAVSIDHNKDGSIGRPEEMLVFSTAIGDKRFLNMAFTMDEKDLVRLNEEGWKPKLIEHFIIAKYELKDDALDVWIIDPAAQRRVIESGKIKGTVKEDDDGDELKFTDTTENLAALMSSPEGDALFEKEPTLHYERVK